jgi:hypothetical protein
MHLALWNPIIGRPVADYDLENPEDVAKFWRNQAPDLPGREVLLPQDYDLTDFKDIVRLVAQLNYRYFDHRWKISESGVQAFEQETTIKIIIDLGKNTSDVTFGRDGCKHLPFRVNLGEDRLTEFFALVPDMLAEAQEYWANLDCGIVGGIPVSHKTMRDLAIEVGRLSQGLCPECEGTLHPEQDDLRRCQSCDALVCSQCGADWRHRDSEQRFLRRHGGTLCTFNGRSVMGAALKLEAHGLVVIKGGVVYPLPPEWTF